MFRFAGIIFCIGVFIARVSAAYSDFGINQTRSNLVDCLYKLVQEEEAFEGKRTIGIFMDENEPKENKLFFGDEINELLQRSSQIDFSWDSSWEYKIHTNVLFVGSVEAFKSLVTRIRKASIDNSGKYQNFYVVLQGFEHDNFIIIEQITQSCWQRLIVNVNILIRNLQGSVQIYTYFPFTKTNCSDSRPVLYNSFQNGKFKWMKPSFPIKTRNLWQCPIRAIVWDIYPFMNISAGVEKVKGSEITFLKALSKAMNFKLEFVLSPDQRGNVHPNGTMTGSFLMLKEGQGDICFGGVYCTPLNNKFHSFTQVYTGGILEIILKQRKAYSSLEMLLIPFDTSTWALIITITLAKRLLKLFFLRQLRIPTICWLLSTFILRSLYGGSIYKFFYDQPSKKLPANFEEMIDRGYVFITKSTMAHFLGLERYEKNLDLFDEEWNEIYDRFEKSDNEKLALITMSHFYRMIASSTGRRYRRPEFPITKVNICGHLKQFSYLSVELDWKIDQLKSSGELYRLFKPATRRFNHSEESAHILVFNELKGNFQILVGLLGMCVLVFVLEVQAKRCKLLRNVLRFIHKF